MYGRKLYRRPALFIAACAPLVVVQPVFADTPGVSDIDTFIKSILNILISLAGLTATVFFVIGGYGYMTASGDPVRLSQAKSRLLHTGIGLSIAIASYVLVSLVTSLATSAFGG